MKHHKRMLALGITLFLILNTAWTALADSDGDPHKGNEIVFLLDTSVSMNHYDKDHMVMDALRQTMYGLPPRDQIGLVAYNTELQAVAPIGAGREELEAQLEGISYTGYTNAVDGLYQAVALFSTDPEVSGRYIVMLTDGEIDMPDEERREESRRRYEEAAGLAKEKGIPIYIVAIGEASAGGRLHIFDGAEITDGAIYWEGQSGSVSQIMNRIVKERMRIPHQVLTGIHDKAAGRGEIRQEILPGLSHLKLVLTGSKELKEVSVRTPGGREERITGERFLILELDSPPPGELFISYETEEAADVEAYRISQYVAAPKVTVSCWSEELPRSEEEVKKNIPPVYKHYAEAAIQLVTVTEEQENLWGQDRFEGREMHYTINGIPYSGQIQQGQLRQTLPVDSVDELEVTVELEETEEIYELQQPVRIQIEKPSDPVFVPVIDYRPLLGILCGLFLSLFVLLLIWFRKKSRMPGRTEQKINPKAEPFSGKLMLYAVRTPGGRDIPPQTYRLFGHSSGSLTLKQILEDCGINLGQAGGEHILFYPGSDHALMIVDQSEGCTVMRGMEIVKKGLEYPVYYHGKLTISFADGETEMEIHYKSLKPSEKQGL